MAKPELEFHDSPSPWQPTANAGTEQKILAEDSENGTVTRLLRFEPGADTSPAGTLTHDYWEEIYVISGDLTDLRLGERFETGHYACRPPGMEHGPWTSEHGALLFEVRYFSA